MKLRERSRQSSAAGKNILAQDASMVKKKLLTLGCAIGILACGACFVPNRYTPPPPPPIVVEGVKSIQVVVINLSESYRLNTSALAATIVGSINARSEQAGVTAHLQGKPEPEEDAIMEVRILSESANPLPTPSVSGEQPWAFEIKSSASLTRRSGQTVWRGRDLTDQFQFDSYSHDVEGMWKDPIIQSEVLTALGNRLKYRVLYQVPAVSAMIEPVAPGLP